jgi:hypothetical protein
LVISAWGWLAPASIFTLASSDLGSTSALGETSLLAEPSRDGLALRRSGSVSGADFQVNTHTSNKQENTAIAMDSTAWCSPSDHCLPCINWLKQNPNLDGDITGNETVDMEDLKSLLFHWKDSCK